MVLSRFDTSTTLCLDVKPFLMTTSPFETCSFSAKRAMSSALAFPFLGGDLIKAFIVTALGESSNNDREDFLAPGCTLTVIRSFGELLY